MKKIRAHLLGVDQGEVALFNDFVNDGAMWVGEGDRELRRAVIFSEPFAEPPSVTVGISLWDISNDANARAEIVAADIRTEGFTIVFKTWSDTKIARLRVAWQAIGASRSDDEYWDV